MKVFLVIFGVFLIFGCGNALNGKTQAKKTCVQTKTCTGDYYFSLSRCDCKWFCADYYCDANRVLKYDAIEEECKCVCPVIHDCTAFNQRWSNTICGCKCNNTLTCPYPMTFSKTSCDCECPAKTCPANQVVLKSKNCDCGCAQELSCPSSEYFDKSSCRCACNPVQCSFGKSQDAFDCSCKCSQPLTCKSYEFFNTETCKCQCSTDDSANCNAKAPFYSWNSDTCSCKFCPEEATMKQRCELLGGKNLWNSVTCSCTFCPHRDLEKADCDGKGSTYGWSESTCNCVFCLNREIRHSNCGSDSTWDDANCSCNLITTTTTTTTTTEATTTSTLPATSAPEPCIEITTSTTISSGNVTVSSTGSASSTAETSPYTGQSTTATTTTSGPFFSLSGPMDTGAVLKVLFEILEDVFNDAFGGMSYEQIVTSLLSGLPGTCNNTV